MNQRTLKGNMHVKPTAVFTPFGGMAEIQMFGLPHNWRLKSKEEEQVNHKEVWERILSVARSAGPCNVFIPRINPEGRHIKCCNGEYFAVTHTTDDRDVHLWRSRDECEGVQLGVGQGCWISSADCYTIIAASRYYKKMIVAHAGRDSLIDRKFLQTGKRHERFESIVDAIMRCFALQGGDDLSVFICGGLSTPEYFGHPIKGEQLMMKENRLLWSYLERYWPQAYVLYHDMLRIALFQFIHEQFIRRGVPPHRIGFDGIDTFSDKSEDDHYLWWSHRRFIEWGNMRIDGRNGIFVIRRW